MKSIVLAVLMSLTTSTAFAGNWSVIVYQTKTGEWAAARGADTREAAEQKALQFCPGCAGTTVAQLQQNSSTKSGEVRETYSNVGWIALAVGKGNTHWGTSGVHDSQANAEASALKNCNGATGNNCYVARSCSSDVDGSIAKPEPATPAATAPTGSTAPTSSVVKPQN